MDKQMNTQLDRNQWLKLGAATAVAWDATAQAQNVFAQETATAEVAAAQTAAVYQAAMADLDIVERQAQLTATYQSYQIELEMTRAVGTRIASDMQAHAQARACLGAWVRLAAR